MSVNFNPPLLICGGVEEGFFNHGFGRSSFRIRMLFPSELMLYRSSRWMWNPSPRRVSAIPKAAFANRSSPAHNSFLLVLAVTLHNVPEGMAVGVAFAGMLAGDGAITPADAFALAVGIALQNIPEGTIVAAPLRSDGCSRSRSFVYGVLSGAVEPVGAVLTILLTALLRPVLPFLLAFAAGAMVYVVLEELNPQAQTGSHGHTGTMGAAAGFALMMAMDVALG